MSTRDSAQNRDKLREVERHHHFRRELIRADDRVALLEEVVVDELRQTQVSDAKRDSSIVWELKHQAGVTQFGRILAAKRGLDVDLATVGALLHDIYTIRTGSYEDHARRGGPIAEELMSDVGGFSAADVDIVLKVVTNHSDKHIASDDEWVEFGKDVDVLDCFLYPHALDEYLLTKPLDKVRHYLSRAKAVWTELGIPCQPGFSSLDHYSSEGWLTKGSRLPEGGFAGLCTIMEDDPYQAPVAVVRMDDSLIAFHSTGMAPKVTTSGRSKVEPPSHNEALLFWPGICRYERLTFDEAALKGIPVISLEGVNT